MDTDNRGRARFPSFLPARRKIEAEAPPAPTKNEVTNADLRGRNLRGADLSGASFGKADVDGAEFHDADLSRADLSSVQNLFAHQLGATNLLGATLPEKITKDFEAGLNQVEELSKNAGKLLVTLLAAVAFMQLAIAKTEDINFFTNSGTTKLPVIDAEIGVTPFFWLGPAVVLGVYFAFHLYLQRIWETMADLPAIFPDGERLERKSYPWLLNDLVRRHFKQLWERRRPLAFFQENLWTFIGYWLAPLSLLPFWARYLCRHDWKLTLLHALALATGAWTARMFLHLARITLRKDTERIDAWQRSWVVGDGLRLFGLSGTVFGVFTLVSWAAITGVSSEERLWRTPEIKTGTLAVLKRWVPKVLTMVGYPPFAQLEGAELSVKPAGWKGNGKDDVSKVKLPANLEGVDLSYAEVGDAFLVRANLGDANLSNANLWYADLSDVGLWNANMSGADLSGANLRKARLIDANLSSAHLSGANLSGADLSGANLRDADLSIAKLTGAIYDNNTRWPYYFDLKKHPELKRKQ